MSSQTETNSAPKMNLIVVTVFVFLAAVNGAPNMEHDYQDNLGNHLDDYENTQHTETTNHLEGLVGTHTESANHDERTENSHHDDEEGGGSEHTESDEDENNHRTNADEREGEESTNNEDESPESSEESDEEDEAKGHKHWFSRHRKHKHSSSDGEEVESTRKKMTNKVQNMVRAKMLQKASNMAGQEVKEDEGGALAKKLGSLVRDATIRKVAPQLFSKPMHGAVNLLKSHFDTMDNEKRSTMATRDLDTFYERAIARDIGFRVADRVINTVSTVVGGALAAGTIHKLHKQSHDDVNDVVAELGADSLDELVEAADEEGQATRMENEVRGLHSRKEHKKGKEHKQKEEHEKGHFWSKKNKHDKQEVEKKDKHHEKKNKHHLWSSKKNKHQEEDSDEDDYDDFDEEVHEKEDQQQHIHHVD